MMSFCVLREAVKVALFPLKVSSRVSTNQLLLWEKPEYSEKGRDEQWTTYGIFHLMHIKDLKAACYELNLELIKLTRTPELH